MYATLRSLYGSNVVIRGTRAWRHLPATNPITPLSCEHAAVWFYPAVWFYHLGVSDIDELGLLGFGGWSWICRD